MPNVNPDTVLVMGESAGSVASYVNAPWIWERFPHAQHTIQFGDSYAPLFGKTGGLQ